MKKKKKRRNKTQLSPTDYLDQEQIRWILSFLKKEAGGGGYRAAVNLFIFQMLLITGLRRGELAGLEIRDLPCFHKKNCIKVRWQVAKNGRERTVRISEQVAGLINGFVGRFRRNCGPKKPLLINEGCCRMTGQNIYSRIRNIGKKTGIHWLHPHALRHTYCTLLYSVQKDQKFVGDQAGHVKPETTDIYVHIGDNERKEQVLGLDWMIT